MKWRTTTRPNGDPSHRETIWGFDVILPRIVSIVAILGALWAGASWCSSVTNSVATARAEQLAAAAALPDKIAAAIEANARVNGLVSRDEWMTDKQAQDAGTARIERKVDVLIERQYWTNSMLEKLPGAKEPKR
jgi:hypothetical protein